MLKHGFFKYWKGEKLAKQTSFFKCSIETIPQDRTIDTTIIQASMNAVEVSYDVFLYHF